MTNPTTNPDLIAAIKKLDKHVPWYEWCDLEYCLVTHGGGTRAPGYYCPPACEASVVMYQENLCAWALQESRGSGRVITNTGFDLEKHGTFTWRFFEPVEDHEGHANNRTEAASALIIAIAASLEE